MRSAQDIDVLNDRPETVVVRRPLRIAVAVAVAVIVVDQLTKVWAERRLVAGPCRAGGDECIDLVLGLRFHLVYNQGAAFSTGSGFGAIFAVVAFVMAIVLFNIARGRTDRFGPPLLGLIAGGAIGNLIDRVFRAEDGPLSGAVIDFVDLQWWPVFNVADSAVVVGVIVFVVYSAFNPAASGEPTGDTPAGG